MIGTKAETLRYLAGLEGAVFVVDPFVAFSARDWKTAPDSILDLVSTRHDLGASLVVRSSAADENVGTRIPPGTFVSVLQVSRANRSDVLSAIETVLRSYDSHPLGRQTALNNEVIVQRQLLDVVVSGVASTTHPSGLYLDIQFDESGRTDSVTRGEDCSRIMLLRSSPPPSRWRRLLTAANELEQATGKALIIEFAISSDGALHLFQARAVRKACGRRSPRARNLLSAAIARVRESSTVWSDMSDWNPAEMLGDRPGALSTSLYMELVTDWAWSEGRVSIGYRKPERTRLVSTIAGKPYVDVRTSLQSLTPASVSHDLATRYVENRLDHLRSSPELHDKIELELISTAADPRPIPRILNHQGCGMSLADLRELDHGYRSLTAGVLRNWRDWASMDLGACQLVHRLRETHPVEQILNSVDPLELLTLVDQRLRQCVEFGVVPFTRQARLAFVAREVLEGLVQAEVLEKKWLANWWTGLDTVGKKVSRAVFDLVHGVRSRAEFDNDFGHLRTRTYDVRCSRYADLPTEHFTASHSPLVDTEDIQPPPLSTRELRRAIDRIAPDSSPAEFFGFASSATRARELLKFTFSALLSDCLEGIARVGELTGLSREEVSQIDLSTFRAAMRNGCDAAEVLRDRADIGREARLNSRMLELPDIIIGARDLEYVRHKKSRPNYVTEKAVVGDVFVLSSYDLHGGAVLTDKIVVVEAADPGLDWLFASGIRGLITRYGGALSHMAVRCAEFQLPAAIGCGDQLYRRVACASRLRLDCREGCVEVLLTDADYPGVI